jgi:hypothetical protein
MSEFLIDRYEAFKERFGAAGVVLGVIAIVLAVGGSAFAASGGLNPKQKKEVKAIAKSFQGQGPKGDAGAAGTNGTNGKDGAPGQQGEPGKDGVNVTSVPASADDCSEGGTKFTSASGTEKVCNGKKGKEGEPGPSCNEQGECLLPSGATETGLWSAFGAAPNPGYGTVSFPLRLSEPPEHEYYVTLLEVSGDTAPTECPGSYDNPLAESATLCVYENLSTFQFTPTLFSFISGDPTSGAALLWNLSGEEAGSAYGTWAVTAP